MQDVDFEEILRAVQAGHSLPHAWYSDEMIAEADIKGIIQQSWQYIGARDHVTNVGDYITGAIGHVPIVIVRNETGVAGFVNVCRHRRHEVMSGSGNARSMQCPYHGWTYNLSGHLKCAPRSQMEPHFDEAKHGLMRVKIDTMGPFLFAHLNADAPSLAQTYPGMADKINETGLVLEDLHHVKREDSCVDQNWKLMLENYLECYHCAGAHPEVCKIVDTSPQNYHLSTAENQFLQEGRIRQTPENLASLQPGDQQHARFYVLWPNTTINISPGQPNVLVESWMPRSGRNTISVSDRYVRRGNDWNLAEKEQAMDTLVARQDEALVESVQRGTRGGYPEITSLLPSSEPLILHFQEMVVGALAAHARR